MSLIFRLIFCSILLFACEKKDSKNLASFEGVQMTMSYRVHIGGLLQSQDKQKASTIIQQVFHEIDTIYNHWNPESELSHLNAAKAEIKQPISTDLSAFLFRTGEIVQLTGGRFDPTIAPLLKVWRNSLRDGKLPSDGEITAAAESVGWDKVHICDGLFWKDHEGTNLDLGGIVKGYTIDLIVERLNAAGYENVFVEWGGEIRASGSHPEGRPWRVGIDNGKSEIVDLIDSAIASSGDYFQNWTVEGVTYFHIIDPKKFSPLIAADCSICSATVTAESCCLADALATAAMLFSNEEESKEWLRQIQTTIPSIHYWVLSRHPKTKSQRRLLATISQDEHGIAVGIEPEAVFDGFGVGFPY